MARPFLISVHFPKAAGSSMKSQLKRFYGNALIEDYDDDPVKLSFQGTAPQRNASSVRDFLSKGIAAIHGHFSPWKYSELSGAFRCTTLRHPIDNLLSIYFFWRKIPAHGNPVHDLFARQMPDIFDFSLYPSIRHLLSKTYFGGVDMRSFDFIGFHETREASLERLSTMLELPIDAAIHDNRTSDDGAELREAIQQDAASIARLETALKDDIHFYDRCRSVWG